MPCAFWPTGTALGQCSGDQAPLEATTGTPPVPLYVAPGQAFHLNVAALGSGNGFSTQEAADIINGLQEWAGVNGISFDYVSAPPGPGVITVQGGSNSDGVEHTQYNYGDPGYASNQITGGTIQFDLGHVYRDPGGAFSYNAYDPNAPNADAYLTSDAAHGMGHVLGLDEVANSGLSTQTSTSVMGGQIGPNNNGFQGTPPAPTGNTPTDCDKASVVNQGAANTGSGGGGGGNSGGGGGGGGGNCYSWGYEYWDDSTNTLTYYYYSSC
jgi:hypothetical protein